MVAEVEFLRDFPHVPVMLTQVLAWLEIQSHDKIIDATYGDGHYSVAFLQRQAQVFAFDCDPEAIAMGKLRKMEEKHKSLHLIDASFRNLVPEMKRRNIEMVDAIVFDLGVSSRQLDDPRRGFSLHQQGHLDMRMSKQGLSAVDIVNEWDAAKLMAMLARGGEVKFAKSIAHAILRGRETKPITDTVQLAEIIARAIARKHHKIGRHPATLAFQAIRIEVNQEKNALSQALLGVDQLLKPGGKLIVVSFHSLEDKIIARHLRGEGGRSRHLPEIAKKKGYQLLTKSAILPDEAEIERNARARSARMRVGQKW